jgi:hypothetical protein
MEGASWGAVGRRGSPHRPPHRVGNLDDSCLEGEYWPKSAALGEGDDVRELLLFVIATPWL